MKDIAERIGRRIAEIRTSLMQAYRALGSNSLYDHDVKRHYFVGDVAPDSLLNRRPGSPPLGAFICVDPETKRITRIWAP